MYATTREDFKTLNTAMCVLHPKYKDALKRIQKVFEEKFTLSCIVKDSIPRDVAEKLILKWIGERSKKEVSELLCEYVKQNRI